MKSTDSLSGSDRRMDARIYRDLRRMVRGEITAGRLLRYETSFRIGGAAAVLVRPRDLEDTGCLLSWAQVNGVPLQVIGGGSNILASDEGYSGILLRLGNRFQGVRPENGPVIEVGAAEPLGRLLVKAQKWGLSGLEPLTGIPGTVGGALVMNAGTREGQIGDVLLGVRVMDSQGELAEIGPEELDLGYRRTRLQESGHLVLSARLKLSPGDQDRVRCRMIQVLSARRENQPLGWPSAGSVFMNPSGTAAGLLLDRAGVKGMRYGGAEISTVHANFILNRGWARSRDVIWLMRRARYLVWQKFSVLLRPEVRLLGGDWDEVLPLLS